MRFKQFIENQIGLGNLNGKMTSLFKHPEYQQFAGAYVSNDINGAESSSTFDVSGKSLKMPSTDFQIPQIRKEGRVVAMELRKNPIYIKLSDGTSAYFTHDEFRRIKGKPEIGAVMRLVFQRHPGDTTENYSKLDSAEVL